MSAFWLPAILVSLHSRVKTKTNLAVLYKNKVVLVAVKCYSFERAGGAVA